ncbi:uncharacterized protein METZ01_LOCUS100517 [marine metagenome]|uniref:Uncharacterized protein n=1 Tax=marine metagenome TaxID=408172 RepID=A0A381W6Y8_9ZZZZ
MGAQDFEVIYDAKTWQDAFRTAVDDAYWSYGHAGYTGSICEKPGARLVTRPKGVKASTLKNTIELADRANEKWYFANEAEQKRAKAKALKALDQMHAWFGEYETDLILSLFDDKWEDALCIELTKSEYPNKYSDPTDRYYERLPRGHKMWIFFGMASS